MSDTKTCPKCNGSMAQGRVMRFNEYSTGDRYLYVWAPDNEPGPTVDLSKMLSGQPLSKTRRPLTAFCCAQCGFTELYGVAGG